MRRFSLRISDIDIRPIEALAFRWGGVDPNLASRLGFEEQYLLFQRHLLANLQSAPCENLDLKPSLLSTSLRAGAIRAYVVNACSVIEEALVAYGEKTGLHPVAALRGRTLAAQMKTWEGADGSPPPELMRIWPSLQLLLAYRDHLRPATTPHSIDIYWQTILAKEEELLEAVAQSINHLSALCRS